MAEYKPDLPEGMALPAGASINVPHEDYRKLEALAKEEGWTQKSFSRVLGLEVSRHERARAAAPAPAPAPDFSKMTTQQQFNHALVNSPGRKPPR
jgi:hypothetical protein